MWFLKLPTSCPTFFVIVALLWSGGQAYAGYHYGLFIFDAADRKGSHALPSQYVRILAYGGHHAVMYFCCSVAGFAAWYLLSTRLDNAGTWSPVTLVALGIVSIVGVAGALPRMLYLGNRPA
jgi:hypothetical protein